MNRLLFFFVIFYSTLSFGQSTVFRDDFENSVVGWTAYGDQFPNYWLANTCAGNGSALPGEFSMYVTFGGTLPGCGGGGVINYGYINAPAGTTKNMTIAHLIEGVCASGLQCTYDRLLNVDGIDDFAEMVYSTDNGLTWTVLGTTLPNSITWETVNVTLPASLDFTNFLLGFRFTYNDQIIGNNPLAIDNFKVTGTITDTEAPIAFCPADQLLFTTASSCEGIMFDYRNLVSATDNCTSGSNFIYTQSPAPGTTVQGNTTIQMTVTDIGGNTDVCTFVAELVDNTDPVIVCLEEMTVAVNSACEFVIPDLSSTVTITDNCSSGSNFIITQTPAAGAIGSGITNVFITVTDEAGNSSVCGTRLFPDDIQAPVVTCPADVTISNGTACDYLMTNYSGSVVVVENCPDYSLYQNPPAGATISAGQNVVTFTATDAVGNESTCSFKVTVIETIPPVITFCPSDITTCNPVVTFSDVTATDNCAVVVTQTDASGLVSGNTFPVGITPMQFTATDSSGNTQVCNFTIEVYEFPSAANIAEDVIQLCELTNAVLTADPITAGTGSWTQISGTSSIANPSNPTTAVSNLSTGTNKFVWEVSSQHCGNFSDTISVIVYQQPTPASIQTDTAYACSALSSLLMGNFPTIGTGQWSTLQGATITNPAQHNTVATNLAPGWNDFVYTMSNGNCPSTTDTLSIYFNNPANILTADTSVCKEASLIVIRGAEPAFGQSAAWYFAQGQGNIVNPDNAVSEVKNLNNGPSKLVYRLSHPVCGFSYDTLSITAAPCNGDEFIIPTVITPNLDGKNDLFVIDNLNNAYPTCEVVIVNRWGTIVYQSTGYKNPWDGTHNGKELPLGTYFYKIQLNDPDKTAYSGPISIIR